MFKTGLQLFAEAVSGKENRLFVSTCRKSRKKEVLKNFVHSQQKMEEQKARMRILRQRRTEQFAHPGSRKQKSQLLLSLRRKKWGS